MSHPLYKPYASGNQSSTQGQYGLSSGLAEKDPQRAPSSSGPGPGSGFSFSGTSSVTSANSGGIIPSLLPQSMSYGPEQIRARIEENMERSIDMHIIRAREEVRLLGKPMHQPIDSRLTRIQRECLSSGTGMVSYPTSSTSAFLGRRYPGVESGSSSSDWSLNYERTTADEPSKVYSSSASSSFARSGDNVLISSSEREHVMQSLPGLGHFEHPLSDKPAAPTESESASNILLHFGLEKEDLDHLVNYPEDQITPANMPFILREIRLEKTKRAMSAVQSKHCSEPQPARMSHSGGAGMRQEEISSAVLEQSKVIDCGHNDKYTEGAGEEIGSISCSRENCGSSGNRLLIYTYGSSRHIEEPPQKNTTQVKSTALAFSCDQASSVSSLSSLYSSKLSSVAPPSNNQTELQIQPNHSSQTILNSSSLPKTDTDIRAVQSEASKPDALKEPESDRQSTTKTQPPCTLYSGVHPSRPDPVLIGSNDNCGNKDQNKSAQGSIAGKIQKQQPISQMQQQQKQKQQTEKQPVSQTEPDADRQSTTKTQPPCTLYCGVHPSGPDPVLIGSNDTSGNKDQNKSEAQGSIAGKIRKQQPKSQMQQQQKQEQQTEKQPVSQTGQEILPSVFSPTESVPPDLNILIITGAMRHLPFIPVGPPPIVSPPALPRPIPDLVEIIDLTLSPSDNQPPAKVSVSKYLPTAAMMRDGAAVTPRIFPHTCCLCNRECFRMKDWIYHKNTIFHLERCKVLLKRYPDWDGDIPSRTSAAGKDAETSPSTSSQTSRHRHKTGHGSRSGSRSRSRSRSPIPGRHHRSEGRREKPSSRSRSPHRCSRRSRSGSRPTSSRCRSRSKSSEKQPSQRRRDEKKRSSPRRRDDRRSSPRRTDEKRLPSFLSDKRRLPPKRTDERRSPRCRRDQRPSTQRERLRSEESVAEKLLENSAVQLLSNKSDLEALVNSLAPIILAELAKRKSPSSSLSSSSSSSSSPSSSSSSSSSNEGKTTLSSSSSSSTAKKELTKKPSEAKPSLQKSEASSSTKTKSVKPSPPTMVKLKGIRSSVSRSDVSAASEAKPSLQKIEASSSTKTKSVKPSPPTMVKLKGIRSSVSRSDVSAALEAKPSLQKSEASSSTKTKSVKPSPPSMVKLKGIHSSVSRSDVSAALEAKPSLQKSEASSSTKTKSVKPSPPTMVKLKGIHSSVSRSDVSAALERFGKTKSFLLFPSKLEAIVCFEKEEDAKQLKCQKSLDVKGIQITVVGGKDTVCVEQKKPPQKKPSTSSVSTPLTTPTITRKVLLPAADMIPLELPKTPPPSPSGAERDTTGRLLESIDKATEAENIPATQENEMPQVFQTVSNSVTPLTVGETIEKHLCQDRIKLFNKESVLWEQTIECFEKEEDAEKLKSQKSLDVKGIQITVVGGKKTVSVEQKKPPLKKPFASSIYTPLNTPTITRKVLLPTPDVIPLELPKTPPSSHSGAERAATENETPQVVHMSIHPPAEDAESMEIGAMGAEVVEPIGTLSEGPRPRWGLKTVGENIEKHLDQDRIYLLEKDKHVPYNCKVMLITNLPEYHDGCYTEEDLAKLLMPFGFQYAEDSIYVIPQTRMAFFRVTQFRIRLKIMEASARNGIFLKSSKLAFHVVASRVSMTPFGFYKSLMQLMRFRVLDDGESIFFIKDISLSESREFREVLKRIKFVKNFLPLLNQVFVEFMSTRDADWFGDWLLKQGPDHKVHRLKMPSIGLKLPLPPKLPENALPDSKDVVAGATIPPIEIRVLQDSIGPFWIPKRTPPFLFRTRAPCFRIPDCLMVRGQDDVAEASGRGSRFPTIMLTGLPAENSSHEDVAKLVWRYFPKRNLRALYYNVVVLPLQRRAFVFFADWTSCCNFVQDHIRNPVCVGFCPLSVHFVLEDIAIESEEMMYTTLMKWSNAEVPDPKLLEERLLCVETSEMSLDIIRVIMGAVASTAPFVGFLPLSNRICIEMAHPRGVTKVVKKQCSRGIFWRKVRSLEPLKSLKQRLQDSDEVTINFEPSSPSCEIKPPAVKSQIFVL